MADTNHETAGTSITHEAPLTILGTVEAEESPLIGCSKEDKVCNLAENKNCYATNSQIYPML